MNMPVPGEQYDILLMDYATGGLDHCLSLLVASHLSLSAAAQRQLALLESLGGALLGECCGEVAMEEDSLDAVLGRLEERETTPPPCPGFDCGCRLPEPLARLMAGRPAGWQRAGRGLQSMTVPTSRRCLLVRAAAGHGVSFRGADRTYILVLEGELRLDGDVWRPGDLIIKEGPHFLRFRTDPAGGCACLVMSEGEVRPTLPLLDWLRGGCV